MREFNVIIDPSPIEGHIWAELSGIPLLQTKIACAIGIHVGAAEFARARLLTLYDHDPFTLEQLGDRSLFDMSYELM